MVFLAVGDTATIAVLDVGCCDSSCRCGGLLLEVSLALASREEEMGTAERTLAVGCFDAEPAAGWAPAGVDLGS